ncbi:MAG TPA: DNA methyltransferase [Thermodesulfovibrionia bacterium]|nr:DNA methyltransferase [Thermodesulfovibrionia bacterium]
MSSYPISLDEIKQKVNKKNGRKKPDFIQPSFFEDSSYPNVKKIINTYGEKIIRVDGDIPVDLAIDREQRFLFISYDQSILTHGLHKYPAKFFPELPRWLIKRYSNIGQIVLDPFAGSGTTNVEALLNYRNSVGIDVDPFSRYLSKVKTTPLNTNDLEYNCHKLLNSILDYQPYLVDKNGLPT